MRYNLGEEDILELVPVSVKKINEDYLIVKKEDMTSLITPRAGAKVIELIVSKKSPSKIKEIIANEFGIDKSTVNITPIIETLVDNGFISQIGDQVLFEENPRWLIQLNYFFTIVMRAYLLEFLLNMDWILLSYPLLRKIFFKQTYIDKAIITRAKVSLVSSGISENRFSKEFENLHKQMAFDKTLFLKLNFNALDKWLSHYFIIEDEEYLKKLQEQRIIFCGYHLGGFESLPYILAKYGIEVHSPVAYKGEFFSQLIERTNTMKDCIITKVPHLLSRSEKDGLLLYRALKNEKSILLFCDTHILLSDVYLNVRFMGKTIKVNRGAALLHKRTQTPIVPVLTHQRGNKCHIIFLPQIKFEECITEQDITQKLFKILEDHISIFPQQWAKWHDLEAMVETNS